MTAFVAQCVHCGILDGGEDADTATSKPKIRARAQSHNNDHEEMDGQRVLIFIEEVSQ